MPICDNGVIKSCSVSIVSSQRQSVMLAPLILATPVPSISTESVEAFVGPFADQQVSEYDQEMSQSVHTSTNRK